MVFFFVSDGFTLFQQSLVCTHKISVERTIIVGMEIADNLN